MTMDLTTTAASAVRTTDLENLAERIDAEHERCASAMRASLHHALEAGRLLLEAKAALPHGAWLPWLRENCSVPERTAQLYIQLSALAEHYKKRREHMHETDEWAAFWGNRAFHEHFEDFTVPFWSCALTDARIAVGIESDQKQDLWHLWMEACA
jgi:hypothetical protein